MAPAVETHVEKKKSRVRKLLSPIVFSGDQHKCKELQPVTKITQSCMRNKNRTTVETAFVGTMQIPCTKMIRTTRSQSLSPVQYCSTRDHHVTAANSDCDSKICKSVVDTNLNYYSLTQFKGRDNINHKSGTPLAISSPIVTRMNLSFENVSNYSSNLNFIDDSCGRISYSHAPYSQYYNRPQASLGKVISESCQSSSCASNNKNDTVSSMLNTFGFQRVSEQFEESSEKDYVIKKRASPMSFCRKEVVSSERKVANSGITCRKILRPQPLYHSPEESQRPRSVSPMTGGTKHSNFVRGTNHRSTTSGNYPGQSVIYEEDNKEARPKSNPTLIAIFKRGTLDGTNHSPVNNNVLKKVSFSPSHEPSSEAIYWPTRKGLAVEPPTRQSARRGDFPNSTDVYGNITSENQSWPAMSNRTTEYVPVNKNHRPVLTTQTRMLVGKWQQQSESESGSEVGEVQRILQNGEIKDPCRTNDDLRTNPSNQRENRRRHAYADHRRPGSNNYKNLTFNRNMHLKVPFFQSPLMRGYPLLSNSMIFDDDPGIMSEVDTSSTGLRRGNKQRTFLPVVRTTSKTLERPLGTVFLQYRNEVKRSLLPNEITSLDTVKALFVRSFPKQLTMEYFDSPQIKIYVHSSNRDIFYELKDQRSHLNEIRDHSVLRLFESVDVEGRNVTCGLLTPTQISNDQDGLYFGEPEFNSDFQYQHMHKTKANESSLVHQPYYTTHSVPPGSSVTLPSRSGPLFRPFSPAIPILPNSHSSDRAYALLQGYSGNLHEDSYYSPTSPVSPIINEEKRDTRLIENCNNLYNNAEIPTADAAISNSRFSTYGLISTVSIPPHNTRLKVELMERQLINLTDFVQKALTQNVPVSLPREQKLNVSSDKMCVKIDREPKKLNEDSQLSPDMYNQLRALQIKAKDLRQEVCTLRRMSLAQTHSFRESVSDMHIKISAFLLNCGESLLWTNGDDFKHNNLSSIEDIYKKEIIRLEANLMKLETAVEELRGNVIARKTCVNMCSVENMALILSRSSKTVADLKLKFPLLQSAMKSAMALEIERVASKENFLKEESDRLENALKRCKKLTGTLVTLKRLASVQEQSLPDNRLSLTTDGAATIPTYTKLHHYVDRQCSVMEASKMNACVEKSEKRGVHVEKSIGISLDELKNVKSVTADSRTHLCQNMYTTFDTKPLIPKSLVKLTAKRIPPFHPSRASSKSPVDFHVNINTLVQLVNCPPCQESPSSLNKKNLDHPASASTSLSCEFINLSESQPRSQDKELERHHQELLHKQKALKEQYTRLQQLQEILSPNLLPLMKTSSKGNILAKFGLGMNTTRNISNSMFQLTSQNIDKTGFISSFNFSKQS